MPQRLLRPRWHYDKPAVGVEVWIWLLVEQVKATWDGTVWRDKQGQVLDDVACWRPLKD